MIEQFRSVTARKVSVKREVGVCVCVCMQVVKRGYKLYQVCASYFLIACLLTMNLWMKMKLS